MSTGRSASLEREIEAVVRARTGRECLFVASGRMGLYLAFRHWVSPGRRILMSPLNDDVVLFTALAAGLRPVMAPVSTGDGNMDADRVPDATWGAIAAVLTSNLYGLPDRVLDLRSRCRRLGIPLLEDAAHALETEVEGRAVGSFGAAAAFSLSKHVGGVGGGVLAFEDPAHRPELQRLRDDTELRRPLLGWVVDSGRPAAERLVIALGLAWPARRARRLLGWVERREYRMPLRASELLHAVAAAPSLDAFEPWVRTDLHCYRARPSLSRLASALARLRRLEVDRARRMEGVERLRPLGVVAPAVREQGPRALFRVPLLVADREGVREELARRVQGIGYVYDPPLDDYAGPPFAEPSPFPEPARWWARHALPVDPLEAAAAAPVVARVARPAEPFSGEGRRR